MFKENNFAGKSDKVKFKATITKWPVQKQTRFTKFMQFTLVSIATKNSQNLFTQYYITIKSIDNADLF